MQRILVATDGSDPARRAVDLAAGLTRTYGARLILVHVLPPLQWPPENTVVPDAVQMLETERRRGGDDLLAQEQGRCAAAGVHVETMLLDGSPARLITEAADKVNADLVVVGSRGLGAFSRMLLGSVSTRLAHTSHRPLLIVP